MEGELHLKGTSVEAADNKEEHNEVISIRCVELPGSHRLIL